MFKPSRNDPSAIVKVTIRHDGKEGWVHYYEWVRDNLECVHFHPEYVGPILHLPRQNLVAGAILPF
jgi:hypothetical protein